MIRTLTVLLLFALFPAHAQAAEHIRLLHVSYDATRELFTEINARFKAHYEARHPDTTIAIRMSHGGSGSQTRAILDGLDADIASLALSADMDRIAAQGLALSPDWRSTTPEAGRLFHSAVVFLVRAGNPKHIRNWDDLTRPGIEVISPNPKSSGGARWNVVAGYLYAKERYKGDETQIRQYLKDSFTRARVMDAGARGATTSFVRRHIGDVLVTWESEARLVAERFHDKGFEVITPDPALRASPAIAVLDGNCNRHHTCDAANAYLAYLASPEGQAIIRAHYMRTGIDALRDIDALGGWEAMNRLLFADGALWDQLFTGRRP